MTSIPPIRVAAPSDDVAAAAQPEELPSLSPTHRSHAGGRGQGHDLTRRSSSGATSQDADISMSLEERLAHASDLLNAEKPRQALTLLLPAAASAEAKGNYGFQSRLGNAYMGVADKLVATNSLGRFLVTADSSGNWLNPTLRAERISSYVGVLGAYGRFMEILQQPDKRALFIEKNGEETLAQSESGVRAGIRHAMLEPEIFVNRISQINSNKASQGFVKRSLKSGRLTESDPIVLSFRKVEADPLYQPIVEATECIIPAAVEQMRQEAQRLQKDMETLRRAFGPNPFDKVVAEATEKLRQQAQDLRQQAQDLEDEPQMFWHTWAQKEKGKLLQLPEYQLAGPYAA